MNSTPSGEQHSISFENQQAVVVEVGGGLRLYQVGERPVIQAYDKGSVCDGAHGAPLIPWPNRLADGRYSFGGEDHQLPIDEVEKSNAIHGLLRWRNWEAEQSSEHQVVVSTRLHPMQGYPFSLEVSITYRLSRAGLEVETTARNFGDHPLPYGSGQHPYLSPGEGTIDSCHLELRAGRRFLTDARQLPLGSELVAGTEFDFFEPRPLGSLAIDSAFTDLARDGEGRAWVHLGGNDGATASLWVDEHYPIVELYTGDTLASDRRRRGLGAEPMTCPPNAFQSGQHLLALAPGEAVTSRFGLSLSG